MPDRIELDAATASRFAACASSSLDRHYPHALQHVMRHVDDRPLPAALHPLFHGSYDWHSSVHMHWSLARLLRLHPQLGEGEAIVARFERRFTNDAAGIELAYLQEHAGFERPYGWAWLMALHDELAALGATHGRALAWAAAIAPLAELLRARWGRFLALAQHPQRAGLHGNSAFAMTLALQHADTNGDAAFAAALRDAARRWFAADVRYPARYEPGANDFLSPGLCEAVLMLRAAPAGFAAWWRSFRPKDDAMTVWLVPAVVSSRSDGQLVHADGLNLSRAWCLRELARALPAASPDRQAFEAAGAAHLRASLGSVTEGDFVATHWLVSFALLALT